jgi:hypothetical protein
VACHGTRCTSEPAPVVACLAASLLQPSLTGPSLSAPAARPSRRQVALAADDPPSAASPRPYVPQSPPPGGPGPVRHIHSGAGREPFLACLNEKLTNRQEASMIRSITGTYDRRHHREPAGNTVDGRSVASSGTSQSQYRHSQQGGWCMCTPLDRSLDCNTTFFIALGDRETLRRSC